MPKRIQLQRRKGWRKPPDAIVVSRPGKWGNPFCAVSERDAGCTFPAGWEFSVTLEQNRSCGLLRTAQAAVELYRWWLRFSPEAAPLRQALPELRGKDLCCWCSLEKPCHADVLLDLANA